MLSYMILFYCWTWCQTAKRITHEIKSIPTLFTGLSNVIPPFVVLSLIKTYGSWRSVLRIRGGFGDRTCQPSLCGRSLSLSLSPAPLTLPIDTSSPRKWEAKWRRSSHRLSLYPRGDTHLITLLKACWVIETEQNGQRSSTSASQWAFITQNKSKGSH